MSIDKRNEILMQKRQESNSTTLQDLMMIELLVHSSANKADFVPQNSCLLMDKVNEFVQYGLFAGGKICICSFVRTCICMCICPYERMYVTHLYLHIYIYVYTRASMHTNR